MKSLKLSFKSVTILHIVIGTILILTACEHKLMNKKYDKFSSVNALNICLQNLFIGDASLYNGEGDDMLFEIQVKNSTNKNISFGYLDQAKDNTIFNSMPSEQKQENPKKDSVFLRGFYLISNEFKTGALKLDQRMANDDELIKGNHSKTLVVWSNSSRLRYFLKKALPKDPQKAYDDVLNFLNSGNYSLIYVSLKDSNVCIVKNKNYKVKVTHSPINEMNRIFKTQE